VKALGRVKANRRRLDVELSGSWRRPLVSVRLLALYATVVPRIREHLRGLVLDAGCGTMPFRRYVRHATYESYDVDRRAADTTFIGDVQDMVAIDSERYDGILCSEVLEHVPHPQRALREFSRVLKPGGMLVASVPFFAGLHEEPHDYYRYTEHGLRVLLEEAGFEVAEIEPIGSVVAFAGHELSVALVCAVWHVPIVRHVVFALAVCLVTLPLFLLDRLLPGVRRVPAGYVVVARRRSPS
jgi:SAM-dependent methyltransferase